MIFFILAVPHTITSTQYTTCAFTQKCLHLCQMMHRLGHEVIHLGTEGSEVECTEHVSVASKKDFDRLFGHPGKNFYNLETQKGPYKAYHDRWAANARAAILARVDKPWSSIIACGWGGCQRVATDGLDQFVVESGVGYPNTWAKYRVFESYAWLHMHLGKENKFGGGCWQDVVIPNAFDPDMFGPIIPDYQDKSKNFLFIGRLNDDKGVQLACDVVKAIGARITIVGQGDPSRLLAQNNKLNPHIQYLPPVGVDERRELMRTARAAFCPSYYVEPFCGTAVELQMSGCPVISTDWGVFNETVLHGQTGYRCRTLEQFKWAAEHVENINPQACRDWAFNNYSLDRVSLCYDEYFKQIMNLGDKGWYQENPDRTELDWLKRIYPA